jgi:hypothetical protein
MYQVQIPVVMEKWLVQQVKSQFGGMAVNVIRSL